MSEEKPSSSRPPTWNSSRRGQVPKYNYKSINEINSSNDSKELYNIYGVVIDIRPAEKSKGSDYFCLLRIVDPTFCFGEGVKVTLFHQNQKFLPCIEQWDVIRLHRVKASCYKGNLSLISTKGWSWTSWKGQAEDDALRNAKSSSATCTIVESDCAKVKALREWIANQGYASLDMVQNSQENSADRNLKDLRSGCFFNLVCQVTGFCKVRNDFLVLKIWDGTRPSHKIEKAACPEDAEVVLMSGLDDIMQYMVDVSVFDNHAKSLEEEGFKLGHFVRFLNLHASPKFSSYDGVPNQACEESSELFLHGGTVFNRGVVILDDDAPGVPKLKERLVNLVDVNPTEDPNRLQSLSTEDMPGQSALESKKSPSPKKRKLTDPVAEKSPGSTESEAEFSTPPQVPLKKFKDNKGSCIDVLPESQIIIQSQDYDEAKSQNTLSILCDMNKSNTQRSNKSQRDFGVQVGESFCLTNETAISRNEDTLEETLYSDENSQEMRCHQKSITAVFGVQSPFQVSSISEVTNAKVSVGKSCLFRVRARVSGKKNFSRIVFHYCPATGLRFLALNDGEKIKLSDQAYQHVCMCRQSYFETATPGREGDDDSQPVTHTQWPVAVDGENEGDHVNVDMQAYECKQDGSKWDSLKLKANITRKRTKDRSRFNILYREDNDCKLNLKTIGRHFHRVVRVCSKEPLISQTIPPVAYQNGIYYYCSPACVGQISIPSLEQEAKKFNPDRPLFALGCPIMPIHFHLEFQLEDSTSTLKVVLKGQNAVDFFDGITPQQYLIDSDQCRQTVVDLLNNLSESEDLFAEVVIKKKSRRSLNGNNEPTILYEIVNTKLLL